MSQGIPTMTTPSEDALASVATAVATLLGGYKQFTFLMLLKDQQPSRVDRFQPAEAEVSSMACDPFLLADKIALKIIHDPNRHTCVFVADRLAVFSMDQKSRQAWHLLVRGWWVPFKQEAS